MSILSVYPSLDFNYAITPSIIYVNTNDDIATVMGTGYLNGTDIIWEITYRAGLTALVNTSEGVVWLNVDLSGEDVSLIKPPEILL